MKVENNMLTRIHHFFGKQTSTTEWKYEPLKGKPEIPETILIKIYELQDEPFSTCLITAVKEKNHALLDFFLDEATRSFADEKMECPPSVAVKAVKSGDLKLVKSIVEKGNADPWKADKNGNPLLIAASYGQLDILKYFVKERKIDLKASELRVLESSGRSPDEMIEYLRSHPVPMGYHLLKAAVRHKHQDVMRYLVEDISIPLNVKNHLHIPLYYSCMSSCTSEDAIRKGNKEKQLNILKYLVKHGLNVNPQPSFLPYLEKNTPLTIACTIGRFDMVEFLVKEAKADVNLSDDHGTLPLHAARNSKYVNEEDKLKILALLEPIADLEIGLARRDAARIAAREIEEKEAKEEDSPTEKEAEEVKNEEIESSPKQNLMDISLREVLNGIPEVVSYLEKKNMPELQAGIR